MKKYGILIRKTKEDKNQLISMCEGLTKAKQTAQSLFDTKEYYGVYVADQKWKPVFVLVNNQ